MKKILKYIFFITGIIVFLVSCKEMDSTYRDYIIPNGIVYPGKATSPIVFSGDKRVKVSWLRGTDASVVKARIYWNNYTDSVEIDIPATGDTISRIISPLSESSYSFMIHTFDANNNKSIPSEVNGTVYGEVYQSRLMNRQIEHAEAYDDNRLVIQWGPADITNGAIATEVRYKNTDGDSTLVLVKINETKSVMFNYVPNSNYHHRTQFVPDTVCIDTFLTSYASTATKLFPKKIDKSEWVATTDSYEPVQQMPNGPPSCAIDDDLTTFWHTRHDPLPMAPFPHWLAVDMKKTVQVSYFELTRRTNNDDNFDKFTLQGSMVGGTDDNNWTDIKEYSMIQANGPQRYDAPEGTKCRHIRIYAKKQKYGRDYAHLMEFSVYGFDIGVE